MAYRVRVSPIALEEAQAAFDWMDARAPDKAATWYTGLLDAIFSLEEMPRRCSIAPENDSVDQEIRHLLYTRNRVMYRIIFSIHEDTVSNEHIVRIHHIRHSAQRPLTGPELRHATED